MKEANAYTDWWAQLQPDWKLAFATTFFLHSNEPNAEELEKLHNTPVLRLVGPKAPYPNMSFELTNLSGIAQLHHLEIVVVTHHRLTAIEELASLNKLKSLFIFNNEIKSLKGIESLTSLEQLYAHVNQIESLQPLEKLIRLKEIYINDNNLHSLEGLTGAHSAHLKSFYCRQGNPIQQKEIIRVEHELGIQCSGL